MTDQQQHPITIPPELVSQWSSEPDYVTPGWGRSRTISEHRLFQLLTRAAQWGADQELEACCEVLKEKGVAWTSLRPVRRPKPPSLKKQALEEVVAFKGMGTCNLDIIRRALEALPDD